MTERGSEMSDLASPAPAEQAVGSPNDGDPTTVIDNELLIAEVKKHPILYNKAYAEYIEKVARSKKWTIVCKSLFKQWSDFSPKKKREKNKIVQNTWQKQQEVFFKSYEGDRKHPTSKRNKNNVDSMKFLVPSAVASDVDVGACPFNTNTDGEYAHIADVMPMDIPLTPEIPQFNIPNKSPMPSTSVQDGDFAKTCKVQKAPFFMPEIGPPPIDPNPNMHFALMLVPLLNRLTQEQLFTAWPNILKVIKDSEVEKRLSILQSELVYPPGVGTTNNLVQENFAEPEQEEALALEKEPVYPSSYGRPTNPDGEIMYPETDHEDLDEA